jgi:rubrerythrin
MNKAAVEAILEFAIGEEEKAAGFYTEMAAVMKKPEMKKIFLEFAEEEKGHKARLTSLKRNWEKEIPAGTGKIPDLKISDYMVSANPSPDMDYQQALTVAMKLEKAAFRMYSDLAAAMTDPDAQHILLILAQEEARHKLRFEVEYEETFMTEN